MLRIERSYPMGSVFSIANFIYPISIFMDVLTWTALELI